MRSAEALAGALAAAALGCGGSPAAPNVVPVTVNGALCAQGSYVDKPCVSVTVCVPGTSQCQTVDDVLLDTGSYGLRVFAQALTIPLAPPAGAGGLAECAQFGDGSAAWGPVVVAGVVLGGEPAVVVPVQIVDAGFGSVPAGCPSPDPDPATAGFHGVLGVGSFAQDCGSACAARPDNGMYFWCSSSGCAGTTAQVPAQVQNPVAALPQDNNGVVLQLPGVPPGGAPSVSGSLLLGIGTRPNNAPRGATAYPLDQSANLSTTFGGSTTVGFLDTGSNGLFFSPPASTPLPACPSPDSGWFCPAATTSLSAVVAGAAGAPSAVVPFQVANLQQLLRSSNAVFDDIGGSALATGGFDWGLPFHLGRTTYLGLEGGSSSLGAGLYVAF